MPKKENKTEAQKKYENIELKGRDLNNRKSRFDINNNKNKETETYVQLDDVDELGKSKNEIKNEELLNDLSNSQEIKIDNSMFNGLDDSNNINNNEVVDDLKSEDNNIINENDIVNDSPDINTNTNQSANNIDTNTKKRKNKDFNEIINSSFNPYDLSDEDLEAMCLDAICDNIMVLDRKDELNMMDIMTAEDTVSRMSKNDRIIMINGVVSKMVKEGKKWENTYSKYTEMKDNFYKDVYGSDEISNDNEEISLENNQDKNDVTNEQKNAENIDTKQLNENIKIINNINEKENELLNDERNSLGLDDDNEMNPIYKEAIRNKAITSSGIKLVDTNLDLSGNLNINEEVQKIQERIKKEQEPIIVSKSPKENIKILEDLIKNDLGCMTYDDLSDDDIQKLSNAHVEVKSNSLYTLFFSRDLSNPEALKIRNKILGNKIPDENTYKKIIKKFNEVRYDVNNNKRENMYSKENLEKELKLYYDAMGMLSNKGIPYHTINKYNMSDAEIDELAHTAFLGEFERQNKLFLSENPLTVESIDNYLKEFKRNFLIVDIQDEINGVTNSLTPSQLRAYRLNDPTDNEVVLQDGEKIDLDEVMQAKKIIEGQSLDKDNMTRAFEMLAKTYKLMNLSTQYNYDNPLIGKLGDVYIQCRDILIKKGLTPDDINYLKDTVESEDLFNERANQIISANRSKELAAIPVKNAANKAYEELAIAYDASTFPTGAELNQDIFVQTAKTYRNLYDYAVACKNNNSNENYTSAVNHLAKIEKFMEIKGFTKTEINHIKTVDLENENRYGEDAPKNITTFSSLAKDHWNIDNLKQKENNNKKEFTVNLDSKNIRQKITINLDDNKIDIKEIEPFDDISIDKHKVYSISHESNVSLNDKNINNNQEIVSNNKVELQIESTSMTIK